VGVCGVGGAWGGGGDMMFSKGTRERSHTVSLSVS